MTYLDKTKPGFLIQSDCTINNIKDVLVNEHQFTLFLKIMMVDDVILTSDKSLKDTRKIFGQVITS